MFWKFSACFPVTPPACCLLLLFAAGTAGRGLDGAGAGAGCF